MRALAILFLVACAGRAHVKPAGPWTEPAMSPVELHVTPCLPSPVVDPSPIVPTGETGSLRIRVRDDATLQPILLGVAVVAQRSDFTDETGEAVITGIPPGEHDLLVIYGDHSVSRRVRIAANEVAQLDLSISLTGPPGPRGVEPGRTPGPDGWICTYGRRP